MAHGVPPPNVSCVRSGEAKVIEGLLRVAREHAGTYRCEATNAQGTAAKNVAITVECEWGSKGQDGLCQNNPDLISSPCVTLCSTDGPSFEELSCPSNWTWVEGSGRLFSCEVDGKPQPRVECVGSRNTSEGVLLPLAPPDPSPRAPSIPSEPTPGIYTCNATNRHGSMVKTVAVSVECERGPGRGGGSRDVGGALDQPSPDALHNCFTAPPQMDESTCPSHQTWLEGAEAAALACTARGHPSPQVRCSREGTIQPQRLHVSRQDAGNYHCLATNAHGTDSRTVTVGVECEWGQHQIEGTWCPDQGHAAVGLPGESHFWEQGIPA